MTTAEVQSVLVSVLAGEQWRDAAGPVPPAQPQLGSSKIVDALET